MNLRERGFSLLEILVVVAVVTALAATASVAVKQLFFRADVARCLNNLRQLGMAAGAYSADNGGMLPQSKHEGPERVWWLIAESYLGNRDCLKSPLDRDASRFLSYRINDFLLEITSKAGFGKYSRIGSIEAPGQTLYLAIGEPDGRNMEHFHFAEFGAGWEVFRSEVLLDAGDGRSQYLFLDGHAARLATGEVKQELNRPGSRFLRPDGNPNK